MRTLLLIDANSIIHRSFHALPPFTAKDGRPTGALYGISSILLKLWREERPDYVAALFDRPEPTFREKKYKEYKAQRPKAPDELISQIIEAHELFKAFGIKTFEKPSFEADDLIATFAEKFGDEEDLSVVVLTGDRDTLQLVRGDKIVVRIFKKGVSDTVTYDEKAIEEKFGLRPSQLVDYKALVGDPSDNIKGVPGIGPKTAGELIKKFGNIENLYGGLSGEPKLEQKLGRFEKEAELAKQLVVLDRNVDIEIGGLDELRVLDNEKDLKNYFLAFGFETLIKRMDSGKEGFSPRPKRQEKNTKRMSGRLL